MRRTENTVLITGGGSGIGFALARKLIAAGNNVIVCGRDEAKLAAAVAVVPGLSTIRADVADAAGREALLNEVWAKYPALNILVNNAGIVNVTDLQNERLSAAIRTGSRDEFDGSGRSRGPVAPNARATA